MNIDNLKLGDIYKLDNHYLMYGDSTNITHINKLLKPKDKYSLYFSDPPYGVTCQNKHGAIGRLEAESKGVRANKYKLMQEDNSTETAKKSYELIKDKTNNQIIFGGNYFTDFLPQSNCWLVWDKLNGSINYGNVEFIYTSFRGRNRIYRQIWNGLIRQGTRIEELNKRIHPTQKPVGVCKEIIYDYTKEGDSIVDLFGGSILIACEATKRICYCMEIEEDYVKAIINRYENFTGNKVEKVE